MKDQQKALELYNKREDLLKDISVIVKQRSELYRQLVLVCPHENTITATEYFEGDYFTVGEYVTIKKCVLCNEKLETTTKSGFYG